MDEYAKEHPSDSSYKMKAKLYESIADEIEPILFEDIPFFFETGALTPSKHESIGRSFSLL